MTKRVRIYAFLVGAVIGTGCAFLAWWSLR